MNIIPSVSCCRLHMIPRVPGRHFPTRHANRRLLSIWRIRQRAPRIEKACPRCGKCFMQRLCSYCSRHSFSCPADCNYHTLARQGKMRKRFRNTSKPNWKKISSTTNWYFKEYQVLKGAASNRAFQAPPSYHRLSRWIFICALNT